jgi:DNA-binding response OmpR family regulator
LTVKTKTRLLLVDDDAMLRQTISAILEHGGFEVHCAENVNEALKLIASETFDVLVSDLHMPHDGDGLTVVSAMRHANPKAVTIIFSAHPEMKAAAAAILAQTDDVLVKPAAVGNLVALIRAKLETGPALTQILTSIATILEEETQATIEDWLARVKADRIVLSIDLDKAKRAAHLPQLFADLVFRLRNPLPLGSRAHISPAAAEHGLLRREQGYTAAMMVEESRMLQVSIFQTLENNLHRVNFSLVLKAVMAIADEVDSQLAQAMTAYVAESKIDAEPVRA